MFTPKWSALPGTRCGPPSSTHAEGPSAAHSLQTLGLRLQLLHQELLGLQLLLHLAQLQGGGLKVAAVMSCFRLGSSDLEERAAASVGAV